MLYFYCYISFCTSRVGAILQEGRLLRLFLSWLWKTLWSNRAYCFQTAAKDEPRKEKNCYFSFSVELIQVNAEKTNLLPKHSIMSLVRVDLFLSWNAREAAFLNIADAAMQPKIVGFIPSSCLPAHWRAQDRKSATLAVKERDIINNVIENDRLQGRYWNNDLMLQNTNIKLQCHMTL